MIQVSVATAFQPRNKSPAVNLLKNLCNRMKMTGRTMYTHTRMTALTGYMSMFENTQP